MPLSTFLVNPWKSKATLYHNGVVLNVSCQASASQTCCSLYDGTERDLVNSCYHHLSSLGDWAKKASWDLKNMNVQKRLVSWLLIDSFSWIYWRMSTSFIVWMLLSFGFASRDELVFLGTTGGFWGNGGFDGTLAFGLEATFKSFSKSSSTLEWEQKISNVWGISELLYVL